MTVALFVGVSLVYVRTVDSLRSPLDVCVIPGPLHSPTRPPGFGIIGEVGRLKENRGGGWRPPRNLGWSGPSRRMGVSLTSWGYSFFCGIRGCGEEITRKLLGPREGRWGARGSR